MPRPKLKLIRGDLSNPDVDLALDAFYAYDARGRKTVSQSPSTAYCQPHCRLCHSEPRFRPL